LRCPSDPVPQINEAKTAARSAYAGCHHDIEAPIDADNHGLLFLNSKIRHSQIYDGSSQTILLGEALTGPNSLGWVSGTRATLRNTSVIEAPQPFPPTPTTQTENPETAGSLVVGGFGSHHPGGALMAFADGSTRYVSQRTEPKTLRLLGHRADAEIIGEF
jgi:hypothetical protein